MLHQCPLDGLKVVWFGPPDIPARCGALVRSEKAGLNKHNACTVDDNDAAISLSLEGRGLGHLESV